MESDLPAPQPLSAPPPVLGAESHRPRRRLWIVAVVVGSVAVFVLLGLYAPESWSYLNSQSGSGAMIDDDMDRGDGPFVAESDPNVSLSYEDGGYQLSLASVDTGSPMGNWQTARAWWPGSTKRSVRVAASFDVRDASSGWLIGVGCAGPSGQYNLVLDDLGTVGIIAEDTLRQRSEPLTGGNEATGEPITIGRLELECRGGGDGSTELTGFVDGEQLVTTTHTNGWESFRGMLLTGAVPPSETLVVLWDDPFAETIH